MLASLRAGELEVHGRIMPASNATFLAEVLDTPQGNLRCVYKPVSGEKPLWDFPHGTLAGRELAAFLVSEALGWRVVPPTVLRDGPAGPGMVQLWCEPDPETESVDLVPRGARREGFLHVLDAHDHRDRPISLVHEDSEPLLRMAVFDVVINNTDRKGGHVLAMGDGHRYGVDHGVCFHHEPKLRTVLWGWAGQELAPELLGDLEGLLADAELRDRLREHLQDREIGALLGRAADLAARRSMPVPSGEWPAIPWPAF